MNRLILIGNGFDLAHGMKTMYKHFIFDYIKNAFKKSNGLDPHRDNLMFICKRVTSLPINFDVFETIEQLCDYFQIADIKKKEEIEFNYLTKIYNDNPSDYLWVCHSDFFANLINRCVDCDWVDIENEYYQQLVVIQKLPDDEKKKSIIELNETFDNIIKLLSEYIRKIDFESKSMKLSKSIYELLVEPINFAKLATLSRKEIDIMRMNFRVSNQLNSDETILPLATMILNFNYTSTIEKYLDSSVSDKLKYKPEVNYIHNTPSKNIVFGFGDELDEKYLLLEKENNNEFLRHIKSFAYFENDNYKDLARFIDSEKFEVFIWGHSCGLSDRTMLNMVFEHDNCKSIKVFHHYISKDKNNYNTLTREISRHFKNKAEMRKKIVSFNENDFLPQIINP